MVSAAELASEIANGLRDHIPINIDEWITQCSRKLTMYKTQIDSIVPPHTASHRYQVQDDGIITPSLHVNCAPFPNLTKTEMTPKLKNAITSVFEFLTGSNKTRETRDDCTIFNRRYVCNTFLTPGVGNTTLPIIRVHNVMMLNANRENHENKLTSFISSIRDWRNPDITLSISNAIRYANGYEFNKLTTSFPLNCHLMDHKADEMSSEEIKPFLRYITDSTPERFGEDLWVSSREHAYVPGFNICTIFFTVCNLAGNIDAVITELQVGSNHNAIETIYSMLGKSRTAIDTFSGSVFQFFHKFSSIEASANILLGKQTRTRYYFANGFGESLRNNAKNILYFSEAISTIALPEETFRGTLLNDDSCQFTSPSCKIRFVYDRNRIRFTIEIVPINSEFDGMDTDNETLNTQEPLNNGDTACIDSGYRRVLDSSDIYSENAFHSIHGTLPIQSIAPTLLRILKLLELH